MLAETMHAHADDDARLDSGANSSIMVVPRLHLRLKTPTPEGTLLYMLPTCGQTRTWRGQEESIYFLACGL